MKRTDDYNNVFKTMKSKHKRFFVSVINERFGKNYPADVKIEMLSDEGYLTGEKTEKGETKPEKRESDFLIRIGGEMYLIEMQSFQDGTMAIRIAEYIFLAARKTAKVENGRAILRMPHFTVIYIKRRKSTPMQTEVTFQFPDGQEITCKENNVFLGDFTKEYLMEKRLFAYIPFYIARYEKELSKGSDIGPAMMDLEYFRDEMMRLYKAGELSYTEMVDLTGFVNTIITHITDGNKAEERLVKVMGGVVLETESEKLIKIGEERGEKRGEARGEARGEEKHALTVYKNCIARGMSEEDARAISGYRK